MNLNLDSFVARAAEQAINLPADNTLSTEPNQAVGDLFNRLSEFLIALAFPLAIAAIIYSAYMLLTSQGKPEAYEKTKKNILYLIIGMFFMIFSSIMVKVVYNFLSLQ